MSVWLPLPKEKTKLVQPRSAPLMEWTSLEVSKEKREGARSGPQTLKTHTTSSSSDRCQPVRGTKA